MRRRLFARIVLVVCGALLAGCTSASRLTPSDSRATLTDNVRPLQVGSYIKHVVIVIQENRSFDNIFAGYPGADAQTWGRMHDGTKVNLVPINWSLPDITHNHATSVMDYDDGKMDKFDLNTTIRSGTLTQVGRNAYSFLAPALVNPYWTMAKRYVLADHMFPTIHGGSFTGHLALIAGMASLAPNLSEVDWPTADPWGCDAPRGTTTSTLDSQGATSNIGPFPCFAQFKSMADSLDAAHVNWAEYAPQITDTTDAARDWTAFDAMKDVRDGADWKARVIAPPQQILTDVGNGKLAEVTWVVPDYLWSDHPFSSGTAQYGPSWVAAIVNAIGQSKEWSNTAIVVVWDDWGGFFDDAVPPQLDYRGLGIRVPCLIISPYVVPHVSHTVYEFGSILKFVEQVFNVPKLGPTANGYTDGRATSILDSFDFSQAPRAFKTIPAPYPPTFFIKHAPSMIAPDND